MLMKLCPKCGKRLSQNESCSCSKFRSRHKLYNAHRRDKEKDNFYHSREWRAIVRAVKARAEGLDEYALSNGQIVAGNTVHHIYTLDERPELKLSLENLIYVSAGTHNWIHIEYERDAESRCSLQKKLLEIINAHNT